ncbi:hypothetical protein [Kribbella swartbergensis]
MEAGHHDIGAPPQPFDAVGNHLRVVGATGHPPPGDGLGRSV